MTDIMTAAPAVRRDTWLWLTQRLTAAILAPLVLVHLVLVVYAVDGGLDAAEILGRTRGSWLWGAYYGLFVVTAAVHGAIGLRTVVAEWAGLRGRAVDMALSLLALILVGLGWRAVLAVVGGTA